MKTIIIAAATVMGMTGLAIADEAKGPAVMTDAQMDLVVAGDLTLPNGRVIFENFDNPNTTRGDPFHPNFSRNARAFEASSNSPNLGGNGNEGPWSAHIMSPMITSPYGCRSRLPVVRRRTSRIA
jgi:hypothetical protein